MSVSLRVGLRALVAGVAGVIFGVGLAVAGMTDPVKVLNFLDILGDWDASLMLVLGGAVVLTFLGYRLILIRQWLTSLVGILRSRILNQFRLRIRRRQSWPLRPVALGCQVFH